MRLTSFSPQPLELTAADELLATENIDVLRQNGFEIDLDGDVAPGEGHRLRLVAQPTSKSTVFDMKGDDQPLPRSLPSLNADRYRSGRTVTFDAGPTNWADGQMFEGTSNVRNACVSEERHDRNAAESPADDIGEPSHSSS